MKLVARWAQVAANEVRICQVRAPFWVLLRFGCAAHRVQAAVRLVLWPAVVQPQASDLDLRDATGLGLRRWPLCTKPLFKIGTKRIEVDVFDRHLPTVVTIVPAATTALADQQANWRPGSRRSVGCFSRRSEADWWWRRAYPDRYAADAPPRNNEDGNCSERGGPLGTIHSIRHPSSRDRS